MTDTIPNVPRDEVQYVLRAMAKNYAGGHRWDHLDGEAVTKAADEIKQLRALLSAPSPAGVDGLEVVALWYADDDLGRAVDYVKIADGEGLCRLSEAQAIIDGLRGENERIRLNIAEYNEAIACYQSERDQQAQRIGELEGLLRHAQKQVPTGSGLHMRIDAALSAGKEGE